MDTEMIRARLAGCQKLLIGLGEEWKWKRGDEAQEARLREAYANLYELVKDKDYFIITMATDALIFETELGSQTETAVTEEIHMEEVSCPAADEQTQVLMDRLFPVTGKAQGQTDTEDRSALRQRDLETVLCGMHEGHLGTG